MKRAFTCTLLGQKSTNQKDERQSFLIIPLTEVEIPTRHGQDKDSLTPTLQSTITVDNSLDDENSSALTQTSEHIGENSC